ncbi:hypothetical protein B0H15DRAFT_957620 [Mycena belliarum]|uniref:Uncharacterized protein n=1 Tax=Mycena belliarum TaxID=1033014 RepID=A0AAD6TMH4_9AGAR|nr:hypothetical protein B0H15DRAFT_957620 [Mycena belliae]
MEHMAGWASQEFREATLADPDFFSCHVSEADRAFTATLGPRARAYVDGPDNGLQFQVFLDGRMIPLGPGLAAFDAAVAEDDAAREADSDSVGGEVPVTSDDLFDALDTASNTSATSLESESWSSHSSMPPLDPASIDDDPVPHAPRPVAPVIPDSVLASRLRWRMRETELGGEGTEPGVAAAVDWEQASIEGSSEAI